MDITIGNILGYIIGYGLIIFCIIFTILLLLGIFFVDVNQPIFKETIEITFKSKDDEDKKDD